MIHHKTPSSWPCFHTVCVQKIKSYTSSHQLQSLPEGIPHAHVWKPEPHKAQAYYILQHLTSTSQVRLVGGFNPFEKYERQNGNLPQIVVKIKNIWKHHLAGFWSINCMDNGTSALTFSWPSIQAYPDHLSTSSTAKTTTLRRIWVRKNYKPIWQSTGFSSENVPPESQDHLKCIQLV